MTTPTKPHLQVAQIFMANKGYPKATPIRVREMPAVNDGERVWELDYFVSGGDLTIEVSWTGSEWDAATIDYSRKQPAVQPGAPQVDALLRARPSR